MGEYSNAAARQLLGRHLTPNESRALESSWRSDASANRAAIRRFATPNDARRAHVRLRIARLARDLPLMADCPNSLEAVVERLDNAGRERFAEKHLSECARCSFVFADQPLCRDRAPVSSLGGRRRAPERRTPDRHPPAQPGPPTHRPSQPQSDAPHPAPPKRFEDYAIALLSATVLVLTLLLVAQHLRVPVVIAEMRSPAAANTPPVVAEPSAPPPRGHDQLLARWPLPTAPSSASPDVEALEERTALKSIEDAASGVPRQPENSPPNPTTQSPVETLDEARPETEHGQAEGAQPVEPAPATVGALEPSGTVEPRDSTSAPPATTPQIRLVILVPATDASAEPDDGQTDADKDLAEIDVDGIAQAIRKKCTAPWAGYDAYRVRDDGTLETISAPSAKGSGPLTDTEGGKADEGLGDVLLGRETVVVAIAIDVLKTNGLLERHETSEAIGAETRVVFVVTRGDLDAEESEEDSAIVLPLLPNDASPIDISKLADAVARHVNRLP